MGIADVVQTLTDQTPAVMAQVHMSVLKNAMDVEASLMDSLLQSMGIGGNLNITA